MLEAEREQEKEEKERELGRIKEKLRAQRAQHKVGGSRGDTSEI